jgi:hypothetical protein
MSYAAGLSKTKLLAYCQCPRRLWLEQYSPELEAESADTNALLAIGRAVGEQARQVYGRAGGTRVTSDQGLRHAIAATEALLAAGGDSPIFEATFNHDGTVVQVDIFDRTTTTPRIVEVKSSTSVRDHHALDCAIQAWTVVQTGQAVGRVALAHINNAFTYAGDDNYDELFVEADLTDDVERLTQTVPGLVERARATLSDLDEPDTPVGPQCFAPYPCPFFDHCAPQGEYPVLALGGKQEQLIGWLRQGHRDLRDVPEEELGSPAQRTISRQTRLGRPHVGAEAAAFVAALEFPRYYLDFESVAFAVPRWAETRPYEQLPFQWSVHVDAGSGAPEPRAFLDLSGAAPMRACAETLIAALGNAGPVIVYSSYERRILGELARRFADLAPALDAIVSRLVDLLPVVREHYYDPRMLGSWSIKSVLPTIGAALDYGALGEVRDGLAAQAAYREAIEPKTSTERREQLRRDMLDYCSHDTLALVELVAFLGRRRD